MKQSEDRKQYIRQHPLAKVCEQQMQRGDYIQSACRNATLDAGYLNQYDIQVNYENVPAGLQQALYYGYGLARHAFYPYSYEKGQEQGSQSGKVNIGVRFERDLRSVNVSIATPSLQSHFENLRMSPVGIPVFVYHPRYNQATLWARKIFQSHSYGKYLYSQYT